MEYTEIDKLNIIDDYNNDVKLIDIGKKYGVSGDTITRYLRIWGIPARDQRKYKFTDEDIEFLKIEYPKRNWDVITTRFPDVPRNKIYCVMSNLHISSDGYFWTEHDKDILIKNYGVLSAKEIQPLLENQYKIRTIQNQAKKLGLTESREWTGEELFILQENYSLVSREELHKLLPRKSDDAISIKARLLNLTSLWKLEHLYTDEEDKVIIDNWEEMSDAEIGELIGRDALSVKTRRKNLGLKREYGKSGYETLVMYIRKNIYDWKRKSMEECDYKCVLTGDTFDAVHHIYGFNLIFQETLNNLDIDDRPSIDDYSDEELSLVLKTFKSIQDKYPLGVCLRRDIHILFHRIYGRGHNTIEQWNKFVEDYNNKIVC